MSAKGFRRKIIRSHHRRVKGIPHADSITRLQAQWAGNSEGRYAGGHGHDFIDIAGGTPDKIEHDHCRGDFAEAGDRAFLIRLVGKQDAAVIGIRHHIGGDAGINRADVGHTMGTGITASLETHTTGEARDGAQPRDQSEKGAQSHRSENTAGKRRGHLSRASPRRNVECAPVLTIQVGGFGPARKCR